jgi:hypothetical protein
MNYCNECECFAVDCDCEFHNKIKSLEDENALLKTRVKELIIWNRDETVTSLESKLAEANALNEARLVNNNNLFDNSNKLELLLCGEQKRAHKLEKKLAVAVEALEEIAKEKLGDFDTGHEYIRQHKLLMNKCQALAEEALKQLSEQ